MFAGAILIAAVLCSVIAYRVYYRDLVKKEDHTTPNRWSWLIWGVSTLVEALTYNAVNQDWMVSTVFFISAAGCVIITLKAWTTSKWEMPSWDEALCVIASFVALVLWLQFHMTFWAHILTVVALPIAFIPTWTKAFVDRKREASSAWLLWTIGDLLTLVLVLLRFESVNELPYILVEFGCHAIVWRIVARN